MKDDVEEGVRSQNKLVGDSNPPAVKTTKSGI